MDYLQLIQDKIVTDEVTLSHHLAQWRFLDEKIVFTNGCFDLLHKGHITYLAQAAAKGAHLIVGLNTDDSVKRLKGEDRPLNPQDARAMALASLLFVDMVLFFDEDTPLRLIQQIQPDVLVKGGDYTLDRIVGADVVLERSGEVITIPFVEGYSTTQMIQKIKKN